MVVVYFKNGEKAPMPDARFVRLDDSAETDMVMLRCLFGDQEVGQFKWDEVAGYTISASRSGEGSAPSSYQAWSRHIEEGI